MSAHAVERRSRVVSTDCFGSSVVSVSVFDAFSVREPPPDGSEYKTIELIALRFRDALRRRVLSTPSDDGKPELRRHSGETMASAGGNGATDPARPWAVSQENS